MQIVEIGYSAADALIASETIKTQGIYLLSGMQ